MQKLFTLLITLAILYTLIQENFFDRGKKDKEEVKEIIPKNVPPGEKNSSEDKKTPFESTQDAVPEGNFVEKTLSKVVANVLKTEDGRVFFEHLITPMKKPINKDGSNSYKINNSDFLNSFFQISTFDQGTIGPAICGHIVTIQYKIFSLNNTLIDAGDKTYTLGFKPILPGIDTIIVGMMQGQTRQAVLPPEYAFGNEKYRRDGVNPQGYYKVSIRLDNIMPNNYITKDDAKIFDDEISYKMPLICGSNVQLDAKITKISNSETIYDSEKEKKKLNITIGDLKYPLIFAYSLFGKIPIGTRTVIAKGKTFRGLLSKETQILGKKELPENEYFMLELKNFDYTNSP